jgi:hypothetical protein
VRRRREREREAALSQRELRPLMVVHTCACFAALYVGPHYTTTNVSENAKAADACGTVRNERKSYTEL